MENASDFAQANQLGKFGLLTFTGESAPEEAAHVEILSANGDLEEAAAHLYGALHTLDSKDLDAILVERFPDHGLGKSINDRIWVILY